MEVIEAQKAMNKSITKNSDTVKLLNMYNIFIMEEMNSKDVSRKGTDDAINRAADVYSR